VRKGRLLTSPSVGSRGYSRILVSELEKKKKGEPRLLLPAWRERSPNPPPKKKEEIEGRTSVEGKGVGRSPLG